MSDIAVWLEKLGLGKYGDVFAENAIDFDVVTELVDADLKELGLPLGDRKRLLRGIAALNKEAVPAADSDSPADEAPKPQAERRQLTVMFIDLVGSTRLSEQLDPEDLSVIIRRYQDCCAGIVGRYEGYVAKFMGDGILVYFGYPQAHEDDAERAVRASLDIIPAISELETAAESELQVRIGIATGLVVVGEMIGSDSSQERTVVGETPNLAARLQALAVPGQILLAESSRQLLGNAFELADLGEQNIKGLSHAMKAYAVQGMHTLESRFEARQTSALGDMVGRDHELGLLLERWRQAKAGEGQLVLLSGEAGIGKSRIVQALIDYLAAEDRYRISYQCSPYHTDSALYPVVQQLILAAGFTAVDNDQTKLDKLEALLGLALSEPRKSAPLIAALLDIDGESRYGKLELEPQQQRAQTLQALIGQLTGLAQHQPVLFVLEDAHWIDPTTLELVELSLDAVKQARILLLLTARPTFEHRFSGHPIVTRLVLNRLDQESSMAIIDSLSAGKSLPAELVDEIIRKTDGVPLFVEELTKAVLESGLLRESGESYVLDKPLENLDIPSSLHDSLMARLDRLQPIREVAQTAACIGREFSYELLSAVTQLDDQHLQAALDQLVEAELLFRSGTPPGAQYTFKHALVRDAAYESLLKSQRHKLHDTIVEMLEQNHPDVSAEILAHHFAAAGQYAKAIDQLQAAGRRAVSQSANAEAIAHYREALRLLYHLPDNETRARRELDLRIELGGPLIGAKGFAHEQTEENFDRAYTLCTHLRDTERMFPVLYGKWVHLLTGPACGSLAVASEFLLLAKRIGKPVPLMNGQRIISVSLISQGRFQEALLHARRGLDLYDPERHSTLYLTFGHDPYVGLQSVSIAWSLWFLGYARQATAASRVSIIRARELNHAHTLAYALHMGALSEWFRGSIDDLEVILAELVPLCAEKNLSLWHLWSQILMAWTRLVRQPDPAGLTAMQGAIEELRTTGHKTFRPFHLSMLADAHRRCGQTDTALRVINEAMALLEQIDEHMDKADLYRQKGELLQTSDVESAQHCFEQAIHIARRQGSKSLELRAVTSLARLWRDRDKHEEAHDLLAPVYDWFTEGFDTADLKDAKALLDELA